MSAADVHARANGPGNAREVFRVFLRLGLTSFGGPIAHLGYFREEFVRRRGWLDDASFARLLSICQFLPGPASSQLGFAIGLLRAGWRGALAAFLAFTLPSALLMFGFALYAPQFLHGPVGSAVVHGLKLVAVVVVSHGLVGMARSLTPDLQRLAIAAGACALVLLADGAGWQFVAILGGGMLGAWLCRPAAFDAAATPPLRYGRRLAGACFVVFLVALACSLIPSGSAPSLRGLAGAFYRAGSFVFGGGHVVLPLLKDELVVSGWIGADTFLAGYGAAQAMPGPMFTLAAYLGASLDLGPPPWLSAGVALMCIFLPGFLLLVAALPAWTALVSRPWAARTVAGINAAVVGLLAAALYDPVWREGVSGLADAAIVAVGWVLVWRLRLSALWVLAWCVGAAVAGSLWIGSPA
ncbi:chromate efflux transporter [Lysobacter sp. ESA13C]|uniref:chromate efflux transporter n=1 Tax=Lysobacter sp. ESA13C TaxID=2862676 RepID=UPI001CBD8E26|nr:chromate efflux transporter [Lysobacter sp. ESA13C]